MRQVSDVSLCRLTAKPRRAGAPWSGAWLIPVALAAACMLCGCPSETPSPKKAVSDEPGPQVQDLEPIPFSQKDSRASYTSAPDGLEVVYLDLGEDVGFIFRSPSNVMVLVDANGNHQPAPATDRVYGVDLDEKRLCVFGLEEDAGACPAERGTVTHALVNVDLPGANEGGRQEILLRIPRTELTGVSAQSLIALETFELDSASRGKQFPAGVVVREGDNPFAQSFRLVRAMNPPEEASKSWLKSQPPAPPPVLPVIPNPVNFRSSVRRECVYFGEKPQLSWNVPAGVTAVDLQPGFGQVSSPQEVSPEATQVYTLRLRRDNGEWAEESLTLQICNVEIKNFRIQPQQVRYGQNFTMLWDVRGAKDIRLTPPGSLRPSTMSSVGQINIRSQSKLTLPASKADYPSPGTYKFILTADGPGGPQTKTAWLQIVE